MTTPNIEELRKLAERIKVIERESEMRRIALHEVMLESDQLRAQLAAIAATEPVAWVRYAENGNIRIWTSASDHSVKLAKETGEPLTPLFTHPMPAQDVTELVDALEHYANPANWQEDFKGVQRTWLEPDSDTRNVYSGFEFAAKALSKYKGAK